jgi:hypothetical protein
MILTSERLEGVHLNLPSKALSFNVKILGNMQIISTVQGSKSKRAVNVERVIHYLIKSLIQDPLPKTFCGNNHSEVPYLAYVPEEIYCLAFVNLNAPIWPRRFLLYRSLHPVPSKSSLASLQRTQNGSFSIHRHYHPTQLA